jgi:hypothetical protein
MGIVARRRVRHPGDRRRDGVVLVAAAVAGCHLTLDIDGIVFGDATGTGGTAAASGGAGGGGGMPPLEDCSKGGDEDGDGLADCADPDCACGCPGDLVNCAGSCVDVQTDLAHCGGCGNACRGEASCLAGVCALACAGGTTKCGDACVSLASDPAHCGGCDTPCAPGQVCIASACAGASCAPGAEEICYSGPPATLYVGACTSGVKTCNPSGTGFGPCVGEVVPAASESCATPVDDNCDGKVNENCVARSCKAVKKANPAAPSGVFTIDPDDTGPQPATDVQCEMVRDGGGWTLGIKAFHQAGVHGNAGSVGIVADGLTKKGNAYKLADAFIRALIGPTENFDVMIDQAGHNASYSTGNFEYVLVKNYTGFFKFDGSVAPSLTPVTMQSFRISDDGLAWTGELKCGYATACGGQSPVGINCEELLSGPNPQGGPGCNLNMGTASDPAWHRIFMSDCGTDTRVDLCNGAQHSSGQDMNHRYWFRERQ